MQIDLDLGEQCCRCHGTRKNKSDGKPCIFCDGTGYRTSVEGEEILCFFLCRVMPLIREIVREEIAAARNPSETSI